jgi:hypothetical protein
MHQAVKEPDRDKFIVAMQKDPRMETSTKINNTIISMVVETKTQYPKATS